MSKSKNEELVKLGNHLRAFRESKDISQEKLALIAEMHRNYMGILERGEQNASYLILLKIAKALEVTISELLDF